jgi:(2R)-3-sulfolactate dehydrogenase (NADP+)
MKKKTVSLSVADLRQIAIDACLSCGASEATARSLGDATLSAACLGRPGMGFPHLVEYLKSLRAGRIDGKAEPRIDHPLPAFIHADARGGIAQLGFDLAFDGLAERARGFGIAVFAQKNSYTTGELGYYVRRLAADGLLSLAVSNAHAMMAAAGGAKPVYGTNPLAFGVPLPPPDAPLIIDQASSATAFVNIVRAAAEKTSIPVGWAVDDQGGETTDPAKALMGALLPVGGYKGGNIALLVEILSAGLAGASWSLDAGNFRSGDRSPGVGLTVIGISPDAVDPRFVERTGDHLRRLVENGVHVPGIAARREPPEDTEKIKVDAEALNAVRAFTG